MLLANTELLILNENITIPLCTMCVYFEDLKESINMLRRLSFLVSKTIQLKKMKQEEHNYTRHPRWLLTQLGIKSMLMLTEI